ncbi:unnamed protein product [Triticum turgidum subsp. durum]|uniref:Uncharacterized protein n=1 Tax=Triticum turgidum subsp. durum TaxID=4567 RepID=A0A9R0RM51_TRITD|nr:unnamed protein product [Triticum turgidum subsp. durum]
MRVEGPNANKTSHLTIMLQIFEVAPSIFMVELERSAGETSEYNKVKTYYSFLHIPATGTPYIITFCMRQLSSLE